MARAAVTEYVSIERLTVAGVTQEAVIHLRGTTWHMRLTYDGGKTYHRESTKERDRQKAEQVARAEFFKKQGVKEQLGFVPRKTTFATVATETLAEFQRTHKENNQPSIHMLKQWTIRINGLIAYFGEYKPAAITRQDWDKYVEHRKATGKARDAKIGQPKARQIKKAEKLGLPEPKASTPERKQLSRATLMHERMAMRAVLQRALEKGLINFIPELKLPKKEYNAKHHVRPTFTPTEINKLMFHLSERLNIKHAIQRRERDILRHYVAILYNSGMRTNDARLLRWNDIQFAIRNDGQEVAIFECRGKNLPHATVTDPECVPWIRSMKKIAWNTKPDDLVFSGPNGKWKTGLVSHLTRVLEDELGMRIDNYGRARTAYSLRHAHVMNKIERGEEHIKIIATNLGTSIKQLDSHYTSHVDVKARLITPSENVDWVNHPDSLERAKNAVADIYRKAGLRKDAY